MDKIEKKHSLKWSTIRYLPFCLIAAILGTYIIGFGTNDLQSWYINRHSDIHLYTSIDYVISMLQENQVEVENHSTAREDISFANLKYFIVFWIISYAQVILVPAWVILCIATAGLIFYNREMKRPIDLLLEASRKIVDNQLDFKIEYKKQNELGMLCTALTGRIGRFTLVMRHNNLMQHDVFYAQWDKIVYNRFFFTAISLMAIVLTVFIYEQKRRGIFNGFSFQINLQNFKRKSKA